MAGRRREAAGRRRAAAAGAWAAEITWGSEMY